MLIGYVLFLIALAELVLGFFLISRYEKNQATMWYGLLAIAIAVYVGANGLGYVDSAVSGRWAEHIAWAGGMATAMFILPFSFTFPLPRRTLRELIPLAVWPLVIIIPGLLFTNLFVQQQSIVRFGQGYTTAAGPYFWFMILIFAAYWVWAIVNLIVRLRSSDGTHRYYLRLILIGIFASLLVSAVFDIYMPLTHVTRYGYVGSFFSTIWLGFTSYIILRK